MSVIDRKIVDCASTDKERTRVTLTISDHLEWTPDNEHLLILQEKINDYLLFIESGELLESYPDAIGLPVNIDVVCQHLPNPDGVKFMALVANTLREANVNFTYRIFNTNTTERGSAANP